MVTYTVMSLSTVRKTCVFQRIQAEKEESEGGELAKDEEEKAEAGEVEKERGVMPEDEEVKAEDGEVEKRLLFSSPYPGETCILFV